MGQRQKTRKGKTNNEEKRDAVEVSEASRDGGETWQRLHLMVLMSWWPGIHGINEARMAEVHGTSRQPKSPEGSVFTAAV